MTELSDSRVSENKVSATEHQVALSQSVSRDAERDAASAPKSCAVNDLKDPFAISARFDNSSSVAPENRGKCIDMSHERPIHVLSSEEIAGLHMAAAAPGETVVANFSYKNNFYIARLPADGVSDIVVQKELFNPGDPVGSKLNSLIGFSAHLQSRFEFNKPGKEVVLTPQDDPANASKEIKLHNIVASDEAVSRVGGEDFNILKGLQGHYAFARRLTGLEEKYDDMILKQHHDVQQWKINPVVNDNQLIDGVKATPDLMRQQYLKSALDLSDKDYQSFQSGHPLMYNTFQQSCITGGFETYDKVNHYSNPIQSELELFHRNPTFIRQMLFTRGMLDLNTYRHGMPDFKTEIEAKGSSMNW